jgi:hypothetical protein
MIGEKVNQLAVEAAKALQLELATSLPPALGLAQEWLDRSPENWEYVQQSANLEPEERQLAALVMDPDRLNDELRKGEADLESHLENLESNLIGKSPEQVAKILAENLVETLRIHYDLGPVRQFG